MSACQTKPNQPTSWTHPAWSALAAAAAAGPAVLGALRPPPRRPRPLLPDFLRPALLAVGFEGAGLRLLAASAAASTWSGRGAGESARGLPKAGQGMWPQQQECSTFDPSAPSALPPAMQPPHPAQQAVLEAAPSSSSAAAGRQAAGQSPAPCCRRCCCRLVRAGQRLGWEGRR